MNNSGCVGTFCTSMHFNLPVLNASSFNNANHELIKIEIIDHILALSCDDITSYSLSEIFQCPTSKDFPCAVKAGFEFAAKTKICLSAAQRVMVVTL